MRTYLKEKELTQNSIEQWCQKLEKCPKRPMNYREIIKYTYYLKYEESQWVADEDEQRSMSEIIRRRLWEYHTYDMTKAATCFLGNICDSVGIAVMYLNYIQYKCRRHGFEKIDMATLVCTIMEGELFTDQTLREMWEQQKFIPNNAGTALQNMLDAKGCMESIRL